MPKPKKPELPAREYIVSRTVIITTCIDADTLSDPQSLHEAFEAAMYEEGENGDFNCQEVDIQIVYDHGKYAEVKDYSEDSDYSDIHRHAK